MIRYLSEPQVLGIHAQLIRRYGGLPGVRDVGLLQSALARPQSGYYEDVIQEASALWESLAQNHPFFDGNKRTAFAVMVTFLSINGIELTAESAEVIAFVDSRYESGTFTFENLDAWLRTHTESRD